MAVQPVSILLPRTAFEPQTSSGLAILGGYVDLTPELRHNLTIHVTRVPVGRNALIADHAIVQPFNLAGQFICSNAVDREGQQVQLGRMRDAWSAILSLARKREPMQVITAHMVYPQMMFTQVAREENADTGTALVVDFEMQQVQRVSVNAGDSDSSGGTGGGTGGGGTGGEGGGGTGGQNDNPADRGRISLVNTTQDREGAIVSGEIPLANLFHQTFDIFLGSTDFYFEVSFVEETSLWAFAMSDVTGKYVKTGNLLVGPVLDLGSYGLLSVRSSSDVDEMPPLPSGTSPWGTSYHFQWSRA